MNLQAIEVGEYYAWERYRQRGKFPMHAQKVLVIGVDKKKHWGNKNATGKITIAYTSHSGHERTEVVNARNIIDYWDDYEVERDGRLLKAEREKEERYQRYKQQQYEETVLHTYLQQKLGIPHSAIKHISASTINLDRKAIEEMLRISYDPIEQMQQSVESLDYEVMAEDE